MFLKIIFDNETACIDDEAQPKVAIQIISPYQKIK